ncbi:MAG: hypothetical protein IJ867_01650 [Clostridia bacterium]|nr:hypothetical protein [Clostridia bacterium]
MKVFIIFFLIVGFFILDLLSKGYIHNWLITFIIAFPIFIRDYILLDKKEFRGYGFHIYCGLGGSGKTISLVNELKRLRMQYPKLKIYTNFYCSFADGVIKDWKDLIDITNYEHIEIDEDEFTRLLMLKPNKEGIDYYKKDDMYFKIVNHRCCIWI